MLDCEALRAWISSWLNPNGKCRVRGLTNEEIAQTLNIGDETVKEHVQHILRKVGVSGRTQAAVWAVRKGLV